MKEIVVIGGGLAGTAAAHSLVEHGYKVTIIEQRNYIGGRIHSESIDGAAIEMGAAFLSANYSNLLKFIKSTTLSNQLYRQQSNILVQRNNKFYTATPLTLLGNTPLSWGAKFHALPILLKTLLHWRRLDMHAFWKADKYDDESVADTYESKSGKEFLEYALQPALNGYFYWSPEHTSRAMVQILCKAAFSHATYRLKGGLQRIPEKAAESSTVLLEHTATKIEHTATDTYDITVNHKGKVHTIHADGIVCATTATAVVSLLPRLTPTQKEFFQSVKYSSGALVAKAYLVEQTYGNKSVAFPRAEGIELSSVTLSQEPGSSNIRYAATKFYASGDKAKALAKLNDVELNTRLTNNAAAAQPLLTTDHAQAITAHTQRWNEALPYFDTGHFKRLRQFANGEIEDQNQSITFAGDYIGGPFMEGAFTSGVQAAERLHARLQKS